MTRSAVWEPITDRRLQDEHQRGPFAAATIPPRRRANNPRLRAALMLAGPRDTTLAFGSELD